MFGSFLCIGSFVTRYMCIITLFDFLFFFLMIRRPPRSTRMTHSFPTRRSSDLGLPSAPMYQRWTFSPGWPVSQSRRAARRSEEHTSELQSLMRISYAVFCLKKKKNNKYKQSKQETNDKKIIQPKAIDNKDQYTI